jgi:hypothetical protein
MPRSNLAKDNWPHFRHLLDQLLENLYNQTEIVRSMLEEGDHADYLDVVADVNTVCRPMVLEFGTTTPSILHPSMQTLRDDANEKTTMAKRELPSRDEVPNVRRQWTFDEQQAIRSALMLGFDSTWLATHLGRTRKGVEHKIDQMRKAGEL